MKPSTPAQNTRRLRLLYIAADLVAVAVAWYIFTVVRFFSLPKALGVSLGSFLTWHDIVLGQIVVPVGMIAIFAISGYYNRPLFRSRVDEAVNTFFATFVGMLGIYFAIMINDHVPERLQNYELMAILWALLFCAVYAVRSAITIRVKKLIDSGAMATDVYIIGADHNARRLAKSLAKNRSYRLVGFIDPDEGGTNGVRDIDGTEVVTLADVEARLAQQSDSCRLIIAPQGAENASRTVALINRLFPLECDILVTPDTYQLVTARSRFDDVVGEPLINISQPAMSPLTMNMKRLADIAISSVALLILSPVFAVIAVCIKRDTHGPVLYRQTRIGYHKRPFKILKFRSMHIDAEQSGPALSHADDPRVTRVGHVLRKYRLDELPQFWNVLVGQMSLVGPRPEREHYVRQIVQRAPYYSLIHRVRPGITSWGMVRYGYASNVDQMIERLRYDLLYIDNVSMALDIKILFHTVNTVATGKGM